VKFPFVVETEKSEAFAYKAVLTSASSKGRSGSPNVSQTVGGGEESVAAIPESILVFEESPLQENKEPTTQSATDKEKYDFALFIG